jgi:hypothetical protein
MEFVTFIPLYFLLTVGSTAAGLLYWISVENIQPVEMKQLKHRKTMLIFILSLLVSPVGAWVITSIVRMRRIVPTLRTTGE